MNKVVPVCRGFLARMAMLMIPFFVVACGGGGGSAGTPVIGGGGGGTGTGGTTVTAADLALVLSTANLPSDGSVKSVLTVSALDSKRNTLANVPVTISVNNNAIATPSATKTDTTGTVTASIGIGSDASKRTIVVTATSGTITKTVNIDVVDPTPGGPAGPVMDVSLSSTLVTALTPSTATISLRSATGAGLGNVVVSLATTRTNLASVSSSSVLTNSSGVATVTLAAGTAGLTGADELVATATVSNVQVSGRRGFTVEGAAPTLTLTAGNTTLKGSAGPIALQATVKDAQAKPVQGQLVNFTSKTGGVTFSNTSALTNAAGVALTTMTPKDGATTSADVVQASATLASKDLLSEVGVQIVGEKPAMTLTLSNSSVSSTSPATVTTVVRDVTGAVVKDAVVSYSSQYGLVAFDAATAKTDATGVASVSVSPRTASTSGGDVIEARVTVGGVAIVGQAALQLVTATSSGTPVLQLNLSTTSISAAAPATVTAHLTDSRGVAVAGQVITFAVTRNLAKTNVVTALTNASGDAVVVMTPFSAASAGADEINASVNYAGVSLQATKGFQVQATNVSIDSLTPLLSPLSAYGQTTLTLGLTGASVTSPVKITLTSACVSQGKASLSPATVSATSATVTIQFRDNGCGAVQEADQIQAVVDGTAVVKALTLPINAPAAASLAFVQASPEAIYLKGSGFTESSIVTFEVRDAAGNQLPGREVELRLQTGAGGVTMEGRGVESIDPLSAGPFTQTSNALGRVSVRVNSGTQPTPVRVHAKLKDITPSIATVSSNLSVAVGLPSQSNFSLSQGTQNIEGYDIDGTPNTYTILASDRSGNPVPIGTSVNFVAEGGQIEAIKQIQQVNGISRLTVNFASSLPRPKDGRVTIIAYALGEESFTDLNGNNIYDPGEPFQDLGNIFKDRYYNNDPAGNEFIGLTINNNSACVAAPATMPRDQNSPSVPGTCDGIWSGAGQVYVRRAVETVFSTSSARPLWPSSAPGNITKTASTINLMTSGDPALPKTPFYPIIDSDIVCTTVKSGSFNILVGDANEIRLNPMAAGTVVTSTTPTQGFSTSVVGGSPVASTREATLAQIGFAFDSVTEGTVVLSFKSPSGLTTSFPMTMKLKATCP